MSKEMLACRFFFIFGLLAGLLAACGPTDATPVVGEAKPYASACDKANDGKTIAITGYLRFPESFSGNQSVVLRFYETGDYKGSPIGVQAAFGGQANQVKMVADQFSDSDLVVYLANGQPAPYGTKMNVSGKVYFPLVGQEFACALENPLFQLAQ